MNNKFGARFGGAKVPSGPNGLRMLAEEMRKGNVVRPVGALSLVRTQSPNLEHQGPVVDATVDTTQKLPIDVDPTTAASE